jgi:acyl dehydratase
MSALTYRLEAYNTATDSTNKIHDDGVAQQYGFRGGLVPGVDVFAYLTRAPAERWGLEWLEGGAMQARFSAPTYDGDQVVVTATDRDDGGLDLALDDSLGNRVASGWASLNAPAIDRPPPPFAPLPAERPPASAEALPVGATLGTISDVWDPQRAARYLGEIREDLPIYRHGADGSPIAHPGWLLRFANTILSRNVLLGPWIHVESDVRLLGVVTPGQTVEARAVVLAEFERKGHRFVTLDVDIRADDEPVQRVTHTAIHTARRVR